MDWRAPGWRWWLGGLGLLLALVLVADWAWHLAHSIPPVARSDHLKAMWRGAPAIEQGAWGAVLAWVFEFTGGHIIAYARTIQLANYLFFDYSGAFIRAAAVLTFVLTWAACAWAVLRTFGWGPASGILLAWSAWLVCSPVLANLATWPEAAPPFLVTTLVAALLVPWLNRGGAGATVGGTVAMAFTNGSGFVFLPAALAVQLPRRLVVVMAALLALLLGAVVLGLWILRARGIELAASLPYSSIDLGMAVRSVQGFAEHPGFFAQYYLALLALPFAPFRIVQTWPWGLALALFTAFVLVRSDHARPGPQRGWLVLAYLGLLGAAVVALSRYGYIDPTNAADAVISSHYAAVVMPLYLALGALTVQLVRTSPRPQAIAIAVVALVLAAACVHKRSGVDRDFSHSWRTEMAIQYGTRNWNIYAAAASLGDTGVGQIALMRFYPELKAWGKYPELTRDLIVEPATLGLAQARRETGASCGKAYVFGPDTRYAWAQPVPGAALHSPQVLAFTRGVGHVDCQADYVVMLGADGAAQCVTRPGPLATYFTEPELKSLPGMGERSFDFSCPGGNAASLWAFDSARRMLIPLQVQPRAAP